MKENLASMTEPSDTIDREVMRKKVLSLNIDLSNPPEFNGATCRGSYAFGTACGLCEKCEWERELILASETNKRPASLREQIIAVLKSVRSGPKNNEYYTNVILDAVSRHITDN